MKRLLFLAVSALALAQGSDGVRADDAGLGSEDRFSTEVVIAPSLTMSAPMSPAYALGIGAIADTGSVLLDPLTTGEIANADAERAAEAIKPSHETQPLPETGHGEASEPSTAHADPEASEAWVTVRGPMPFDIIRTIQFLQDQVARGNGRAIQVQAMLLRRFGPVFASAPDDAWKDGRNKRAAVLFVLSGGPPEVLRQLMTRGVLEEADKPLFEGALAYVENDLDKAGKLLSGLDFTGMEPGLEGHINLVLGQLKQVKDPKASILHLDKARLLAPGGLIEEAALRMEMLIVDGLGDHGRADHLARQYFDRYFRSSYSANFEARFAVVYAERGQSEPEAAFATMLDVTRRLAPANRRTIFLAVGRRALFVGNLKFAGLSAEEALAIDGISDPDRQRATLYTVAARIGSTPADEARARLATVDRGMLHPEDVQLYDAAASVLAGIDRTPEIARTDASSEQLAETSPLFDRAQQILGEVDSDLGKARP